MYMKKMPFPGKAAAQKAGAKKPMPKEADMALELEVESEEEPEMEGEEMDLKSMMAEGKGETEMGPLSEGALAEASDEELMAEMKKRGLMPAEAASKPPMMK